MTDRQHFQRALRARCKPAFGERAPDRAIAPLMPALPAHCPATTPVPCTLLELLLEVNAVTASVEEATEVAIALINSRTVVLTGLFAGALVEYPGAASPEASPAAPPAAGSLGH